MPINEVLVVQDLAIVMLVALGMTLLFRAIHQPLLIGYIVAGMIIGPYTPPTSLVSYPDVLNALAELGIVFLLFAIGLEYPLARLRSIGRKALVIALAESLATFAAGFAVGRAFGFPLYDSLFLALAISVTSTVILSSVLQDLGVILAPETSLILGITVIEDVITVTILGILQSTASTGHLSLELIAFSLAAVVIFIAGVLTIGSRTIPPLIDRAQRAHVHEIFLLAILGVAFSLAIISSLIGISVATGAFLAGVLVAESGSQAAAHEVMAPLKEMFGAIFFVSMGALMNISLLPQYLVPIAGFIAVAFGAKLTSTYLAARQQRVPPADARRAAITVSASGGELSIVVAKGGTDVGAVGAFVLPFIGALTIVTTLVAPYLVRYAWRRPAAPAAPPP
ncbi:MAG TPA: cation:proton antiporter [Thermoplasmata archaeon]|nr:cation:proton antiporter [Thermoplasmata archaeon]